MCKHRNSKSRSPIKAITVSYTKKTFGDVKVGEKEIHSF